MSPIEWLFVVGGAAWVAAMGWEARHDLDANVIAAILLLAPLGAGLLPMWYGIKWSVRS